MPLISHQRPEYEVGTPCKLGIDEAGRGAFLGAMVYGCAYWPIVEDEACIAMGFDGAQRRGTRHLFADAPHPAPAVAHTHAHTRRLKGAHGGAPRGAL